MLQCNTKEKEGGRRECSYVQIVVRERFYVEVGFRGCVHGLAAPLGPSIEGIGFRRAFAIGIRGTP